MNETLKFLAPLVDASLLKLSLNDLALLYQEKSDSHILATAYNKIFKLAITVKNKYWGLDEAEIASYCLEKLDFCLRTYTQGYQFTTYFCKVFSNKLREETENLNRKKRKCILESINDVVNIGVEDTYNIIEMLLPTNLTDREKTLCIMESEGYDRKDIADILGVSRMTVHNIEKSLKVKLVDLQN